MASTWPPSISFEDANTSPAHWTIEQEDIFMDLMVEEVLKGNRTTNSFGGKTWKKICTDFYAKTGKKYVLKQFQNKHSQLRLRYKTFTDLKRVPTGFGWDPVLNTATAADDTWEKYLRAHPEAKRFRKETCRRYDDLLTIYGDTTATGKEAHASTQDISDSDDETQDTTFASTGDVNVDIEEDSGQLRNRQRPRDEIPSANRNVRSQPSRTSELSDAIKLLAEASYARTGALSQHSVGTSSSVETYSIARCIEILDNIEGVDMPTYLKALEKFQEKGWRETFISMSSERRLGWLASLQ